MDVHHLVGRPAFVAALVAALVTWPNSVDAQGIKLPSAKVAKQAAKRAIVGPSDAHKTGIIGPSDRKKGAIIGPSDAHKSGIIGPTDSRRGRAGTVPAASGAAKALQKVPARPPAE